MWSNLGLGLDRLVDLGTVLAGRAFRSIWQISGWTIRGASRAESGPRPDFVQGVIGDAGPGRGLESATQLPYQDVVFPVLLGDSKNIFPFSKNSKNNSSKMA